jgi:hypothetical protein
MELLSPAKDVEIYMKIITGITLAIFASLASSELMASVKMENDLKFMQGEDWKRFVVSIDSMETSSATTEVALECNVRDRSVFFDYFAIRLEQKTAANPDGFSGPKINAVLPDFGEDWVQWNGLIPLIISDGHTSRDLQLPYQLQETKPASGSSVKTHFIKMNAGPMRTREATLVRGSKKEISQWIVAETSKSIGIAIGGGDMLVSGSTMSGSKYSAGFNLKNIQNVLTGALSDICD